VSEDRSSTLVLVEDEASIREIAATVLQREGWAVLSASGAVEALALCREFPDPIAAVITDCHLKDGDGIDVAREICSERPGIAVVAMSGFPENAQRATDLGYTFLPKPFLPSTLVEVVRSLLPSRMPACSERRERGSARSAAGRGDAKG
jgi:two-component system cell cycle sensor histidine kinase/response regulator CckA